MIYLKEGNVPLNAAYDDEIVQEANGTYQLTFKFPTNSQQFTTLKEEALLLADDLHGEQEFIIFEIVNNHGYCTVYANQVVSLLNGYSISTLSVDRVSGTSVMSALSGSIVRRNNFSFYSDIQEFHTLNLKNVSVMDALAKDQHSIIGQWGGDLVRDKYDVRLLKNGGSENESLFMYKKNMRTYKQSKSIKELRTRIHFRKKLDDDKEISVTVDSPLIGQYKNIYEYDMEVSDQDVVDVNTLREYGRRYYKETLCDIVENSIELDVVNPDTNLKMFDVVSIYHERFDLDIRKKISKYKYSPMGKRLKSIGFGKVQQGLSSTISGMVNTQVAQQTKYLVNDVNTRVEKEIKNADLMFDRKVEKFKEDFDLGLNQATAQVEIIRAETDAKLRDNLRQFEKQVSDISTHFNDTIGQYGTVIEENQTKIEQTTNELTGIRQSVANLSGDILKKSELEITPDRITFGAGKVVDGRTIASLVSVSPEATNIISDTVTITGNQYNLVFKNKRETFKSSIKGIDATPKYNVPLTENDAFLLEGDYSADIPINLTAVLWLFLDTGKAINVRLTNLTKGSNGSFSKEFRVIKTIRPIVGFNFAMYQEQNPLTEYTINNFRIVRKTTSNLLVDGSITAQKIAAGSIETPHLKAGSVTAEILSANAVTADKLKVDTAMANKLSANDALINNLVSKNAFINKVKSIDIDAARITSGVLRSTNGATQFNLNNGSLKFYTDSPAISRELAGYPTQFIKLTTGNHTTQGKTIPIGVTVIGSNRWGTGNSNDGGFVGVRLWNGQKDGVTLDEVDVVGDRVSLLAAANTNPSGWNIDTWVNKEGKRVIDMVNASDRPGSLLRIGNVHLFHKSGNTYSDLVDILRNIRQNILLLHNHKDGAGYSYNIYNI